MSELAICIVAMAVVLVALAAALGATVWLLARRVTQPEGALVDQVLYNTINAFNTGREVGRQSAERADIPLATGATRPQTPDSPPPAWDEPEVIGRN